ncbi:MAG: phosphoserine phosphatase SerB, partial [Nitriliruptoraceae bacterium]
MSARTAVGQMSPGAEPVTATLAAMDTDHRTVLVRCTCHDRPGITTGLLGVLARAGAELYDMEQVSVRERLTLGLLIGVGSADDVLKELLFHGWEHGLQLEFEVVDSDAPPSAPQHRAIVTVIAQTLAPAALQAVTAAISGAGGNIDRIERLARYPVVAYEFGVSDGDTARMRSLLVDASADHHIDVAVQEASLERRAKRLVVLDVDSTLIQDEVIDLLAEEAGCAGQVADLTAQAMDGAIDFEAALRARVRLLAGLDVAVFDRVAERIEFTPGARTFVRTLKRLGYTVAIVSGGFSVLTDRLAAELGIDHTAANDIEIVDGRLTGEVRGDVLDRAGKARVVRQIAESEHIPLSQTVAV